MSLDLPDYHQYVTPVSVNVPGGSEPAFIVRPKGGTLAKNNVTSTAKYQTLVEHIVTDAKKLQLSKIMVAAKEAAWIKLTWDGTDISEERLVPDDSPLIEHFPWDYATMLGDGIKKVTIEVIYDTAAGKVTGEIVGEEV